MPRGDCVVGGCEVLLSNGTLHDGKVVVHTWHHLVSPNGDPLPIHGFSWRLPFKNANLLVEAHRSIGPASKLVAGLGQHICATQAPPEIRGARERKQVKKIRSGESARNVQFATATSKWGPNTKRSYFSYMCCDLR